MKRISKLSQLAPEDRGGALTIGNFDGVHRGHAQLISRLLTNAKLLGGPAIVFTFDPHPAEVLRPGNSPPPLTTSESKCERLGELGVGVVVTYPTDMALLSLGPDAFFDEVIISSLGAQAVVEGPNFRFGAERAGSIEKLRQLCNERSIKLDVVQPIEFGGQRSISSSRIREAIGEGDVESAAAMLGRPYQIAGAVGQGAQRGRQLGFPTANLVEIPTLLPPLGVYAGRNVRGRSAMASSHSHWAQPNIR